MYKVVLQHFKLFGAGVAGLALFMVLPAHWPLLTRVLVGWNFGVILFLAAVFAWMSRLTARQLWSRYKEEDATASVIMVVVIVAALLSLIAIVVLLSTVREVTGVQRTLHVALATLTIVTSWMLVPTMFALHYADMFYSTAENERPLAFPQTPLPVFWDFAYFSFTIAAACQTADVATTNADMRKSVLGHTLISFLFNASILGFAINITAGLFSAT